MIAATNPFLGKGSPIMPLGTVRVAQAEMLLIETHGGRIARFFRDMPRETLRQICEGEGFLKMYFPLYGEPAGRVEAPFRRQVRRAPLVGFDRDAALAALVDACAHVQDRRAGKLGSAAA